MSTPKDFQLHPAGNGVSRVLCTRCDREIGRVETVPSDIHGDAALERAEEIQGELKLLADEHLAYCAAVPH